MSKENAITFLALVPLFLYFFSGEKPRKIIFLSATYLIPALIFWLLRGHFTKSSVTMEVTEVLNNPFVYMTALQKYATVVFTWGKYLLFLIFPHPLTHDYYYNQITPKSFTELSVVLTILIHTALAFIAIKGIRKKSLLSFSILFYFITFSVVSNLLFPIGTFMSERFVYISSFGFCIVMAWALVKYLSPKNSSAEALKLSSPAYRKIFILSLLILTGYSFRTIMRNEAWKDNYTLFLTDIETSPNSAKLRNSVGGEVMAYADKETDPVKRRELLQKSIANLNKALEIYPGYVGAWLLLGNAYFKLDNQYGKAVECYEQLLKIQPNHPDAYLNLGITYKQMGNTYSSNKSLLKYLSYKPNDAQAYFMIGDNCKKHNQPDSAIAFFVKTAEIQPDYPDIYREIGSIYGQIKNDLTSAAFYLQKAVEQNPKDKTSLENLAIVYGIKKDYDKAIEIFNKSLAIDPNNANVLRNLAVTYAQKGDKENAEKYFTKANEVMGKR
jgi:tetratricopeptide (TPR) repeat protein